MAGRQDAAGRGRPPAGLTALEVVVHDLAQARAALAAAEALGVAIRLRSAPGAAAHAGVGYLQALGRACGRALLIDCGEDAGLVMAALRTGSRRLVFSGDPATAGKLRDMAEQVGAELRHETGPGEALVLDPDDAAALALRRALAARRDNPRPDP